MSKQIAQTVGDKRIAILIALLAAFAVLATLATQWSYASATVTDEANAATSAPVENSAFPTVNLPDIRGSTSSAVHEFAGFTNSLVDSIISAVEPKSLVADPSIVAVLAAIVAFAVLIRVIKLGPLTVPADPRYVRRHNLGHFRKSNTDNPLNVRLSALATRRRIWTKVYFQSAIAIAGFVHRTLVGIIANVRASARSLGGWVSYPIIAPISTVRFAFGNHAAHPVATPNNLLHTSLGAKLEHVITTVDIAANLVTTQSQPAHLRPAFALRI